MKLKTLGGLSLESATFTRPKPLLLLTFLSLEGPQLRRHLAELFFSGRQLKNLSMSITRLHQALGPVIDSDAKRCWANISNDADDLLQALNAKQWEQADQLYRGPFLEGFYLEDWSSELEEWVYKTREYITERLQYGLLEYVQDLVRQGNTKKAITYTERIYRLSGETEPAILREIYPILKSVKHPLAIQIKDELQGYGEFLPLSLDTPLKLPRGLSPKTTSFIGREKDLEQLAAILEQPSCRLLTILGEAGIGKTRLATEFAHTYHSRFEEAYFVALETLEQVSQLSAYVAHTLGLQTSADVHQNIIDFVANRPLLIILDNFEQLVEGAHNITTWLRHCSQLKIVVTSRNRLYLTEEFLYPLRGLSLPTNMNHWHDVEASDAMKLFIARAKQHDPLFNVNQEWPYIAQIAKQVEGLPLALELASSWIRTLSCKDISLELKQNLDLLATQNHDIPKRHQNLKAAFDYSWRLLSVKEQDALARLSIFQGRFSREAASYIAGVTIPVLASLIDKSLLKVVTQGYYAFHPLVWQFASKQCSNEQKDELSKKYWQYYHRMLQGHAEALTKGQQDHVLIELQHEWDNIRLVYESCLQLQHIEELVDWIDLMDSYHDAIAALPEGLDWLNRAAQMVEPHKDHYVAMYGRILLEKAWFEFRLGSYEKAKHTAQQALAYLPPDHLQWKLRLLNTLGLAECRSNHSQIGLGYLKESLDIARALGDDIVLAKALASVASIEQNEQHIQSAEHHFLEAIDLLKKHKRTVNLIRELNNLAWLYYTSSRPTLARPLLEEGLKLARHLNAKQNLPYLLNNLGYILLDEGKLDEAYALNLEALAIANNSNERVIQAEILASLTRIATKQANLEQALKNYNAYFLNRPLIDYIPVLCQALLARAELLLAQHRLPQTIEICQAITHHAPTEAHLAKRLLESIHHPSPPLTEPSNLAKLVQSLLEDQPIAKT